MGKRHKKNVKQYLAEKYLPQLRELTKDWDIKIMSYVMIVIVMVASIAATVAWFTQQGSSTVSNMSIMTAQSNSLKVEVKQGMIDDSTINFVEVGADQEDSIAADLDMPLFDNVESYDVSSADGSGTKKASKMAPGVYGSLTIRLTPLGADINQYSITGETLLQYVGDAAAPDSGQTSAITDADKAVLENLAKGHILFFKNRIEIPESNDGNITIDGTAAPIADYTHNKKYVFYNPFDEESPMTGKLEWDTDNDEGIPEEVTIYWYWPYEYANLAGNIKDRIMLPAGMTAEEITAERLKYFDIDRMNEIVVDSISWNETQLYDYADTRIGTYVKSMKLHLKVKGYHADETTTG